MPQLPTEILYSLLGAIIAIAIVLVIWAVKRSYKRDLDGLGGRVKKIDDQFSIVYDLNKRIEVRKRDLNELERRVNRIEEIIEKRTFPVGNKVTDLESRLAGVERKLESFEKKFENLDRLVGEVSLIRFLLQDLFKGKQ